MSLGGLALKILELVDTSRDAGHQQMVRALEQLYQPARSDCPVLHTAESEAARPKGWDWEEEERVDTIVHLETLWDPLTLGFLLQGRCGGIGVSWLVDTGTLMPCYLKGKETHACGAAAVAGKD